MGLVIPTFWEQRRSGYSYPNVGLREEVGALVHVEFASTREVDSHHFTLLTSTEPADVRLGYVSAVYWGRYAGADGRTHRSRAMARASAADATAGEAQAVIGAAINNLNAGHISAAIMVLTDLPELGFAFATKVCAFLSPQTCGVADSVIAERYPVLGFATDKGGFITNTASNRIRYQTFCQCLAQTAGHLNEAGSVWTDRDQLTAQWRAVDVERALFVPG